MEEKTIERDGIGGDKRMRGAKQYIGHPTLNSGGLFNLTFTLTFTIFLSAFIYLFPSPKY